MSTTHRNDTLEDTLGDRFQAHLCEHGKAPLKARSLATLQVNLGKLCNQACKHCHVEAGPGKTDPEDNMGSETTDLVIQVLETGAFESLDLTGGAPELNPQFRRLVKAAHGLSVQVLDRCNLSVLYEPGQEDLAQFLADHDVEVVASLPYYRKSRTDAQRGKGVFDKSVEGLKLLNSHGYAQPDSDLVLDLVYNPGGAYLPGPQAELEQEFKRMLERDHGIHFSRLFALTNLPIKRFRDYLVRSDNLESYQERLEGAFNPLAADQVMCRDMLSVGPNGCLYDCDFNQMLAMPVERGHCHLSDLLTAEGRTALEQRSIRTDSHCFGCTAGAGSSCGGTVT
jgi:radical SAM/Cys-rich protein